jgi:hypothetical protein
VLLQAGMFSDTLDWLSVSYSTELNAVPLQLALIGYDMWISSGRGRLFSDTHVLYDKDDAVSGAAEYWDYTFQDVGE